MGRHGNGHESMESYHGHRFHKRSHSRYSRSYSRSHSRNHQWNDYYHRSGSNPTQLSRARGNNFHGRARGRHSTFSLQKKNDDLYQTNKDLIDEKSQLKKDVKNLENEKLQLKVEKIKMEKQMKAMDKKMKAMAKKMKTMAGEIKWQEDVNKYNGGKLAVAQQQWSKLSHNLRRARKRMEENGVQHQINDRMFVRLF